MTLLFRIALLVAAATTAGCKSGAEKEKQTAIELNARVHRMNALLARADSNPKTNHPVAMWIMPPELREISGLALTADGRLLAHDDEEGKVYELDPRRGMIVKSFTLGDGPKKDFEAITIVGPDIYMLVSDGVLYRFREGANNSRVQYQVIDTHLGKECEFEGLVYEPDSSRLLMPCKVVHKKDLKGNLVIYKLKLPIEPGALSVQAIPMEDVTSEHNWKEFRPSDMTIDPLTRNYVIISAREPAIIEVTPDGDVLKAEKLPGHHLQAEGVAITPDSILMISDEATSKPAAITLYRWRRPATTVTQ
jgi:uncharacterized protein YjiK